MNTQEIINETKPKFTGKRIVMLDKSAKHSDVTRKAKSASIILASMGDYSTKKNYLEAFKEADGIIFDEFKVAVVNDNKVKEINTLTSAVKTKDTFLYSEPERFVYAYNPVSDEFLRGYKAAVDDLYSRVFKGDKSANQKHLETLTDTGNVTWGIQATNVLNSKYTGKGVNVAILDTGINLTHSDFAGRTVVSKSFVRLQSANDKNGHGTHCVGIAAGGINKKTNVRYGVATEANIYAGKVLGNDGSGTDGGILAGINWAMENKCKVISMSLGAEVEPGQSYSRIYNDIAKRAMSLGTIIVAAAGNESDRLNGKIKPVGHPANCPAIMAVGALDKNMQVAWFSCGGLNEDGGQVDIAAPGVEIYSSWKKPQLYETIDGTSMATPFVAGIIALYCEAYPKATASEIWVRVIQNAKRLHLNASDIGSGFVQA
jgi:subtilisin